MSQRLEMAITAGTVVVRNRGQVEVSVTMVRLVDNPNNPRRKRHVKDIVTLKPGKERDLTRSYSLAEIRASCRQAKGLRNAINRRPIEVVDTWTD
jgi:hypothetical protein